MVKVGGMPDRILLDTNILIDLLRQRSEALAFFQGLLTEVIVPYTKP